MFLEPLWVFTRLEPAPRACPTSRAAGWPSAPQGSGTRALADEAACRAAASTPAMPSCVALRGPARRAPPSRWARSTPCSSSAPPSAQAVRDLARDARRAAHGLRPRRRLRPARPDDREGGAGARRARLPPRPPGPANRACRPRPPTSMVRDDLHPALKDLLMIAAGRGARGGLPVQRSRPLSGALPDGAAARRRGRALLRATARHSCSATCRSGPPTWSTALPSC